MEWDTTGLYREACDGFTTANDRAVRGRAILDELAQIKETLRVMGNLKEVRIASCNNSSWNPGIATDEVAAFVTRTLNGRRDELVHTFNTLFGTKKRG